MSSPMDRWSDGTTPDDGAADADAGIAKRPERHTGRYLVLLAPDGADAGMAALTSRVGVPRAERVRATAVEEAAELVDRAGAALFEEMDVALVTAAPDQESALRATVQERPELLAVEPERVVYASGTPGPRPGGAPASPGTVTADYLRGYHDGVEELVQRALERVGLTEQPAAEAPPEIEWDESEVTWGLQACGVDRSVYTGQGVRVAVLDTGADIGHADLDGRFGGAVSFVPGQEVTDRHGHGTHCVGTACGSRAPNVPPRYGVAAGAWIHAGKVLGDDGSGTDGQILAGLNWAVGQGCRVVSMSLGAPTRRGERYSPVFEQAARRALRAGTLVVAAAGNESMRPDRVEPVGHPANCPSVLAVGALDRALRVAPFSCAGLTADGGQVDLAAPGADVLSTWPGNRYRRLSGTSMATPHVAGVLALLAEENPEASAAELKSLLLSRARRLSLPAVDVGAGLVQAP